MSEVAKSRGIAVPHDLDIQVTNMFTKTAIISRQAAKWIQKRGLNKEISSNSVSSHLVLVKDNMTNLLKFTQISSAKEWIEPSLKDSMTLSQSWKTI